MADIINQSLLKREWEYWWASAAKTSNAVLMHWSDVFPALTLQYEDLTTPFIVIYGNYGASVSPPYYSYHLCELSYHQTSTISAP